MKKIGTLALTLALAGSLTVPALAAEETAVPISADTGYGTALVLNGETLDLTGIPGVEGGTLLPLRLVAEADTAPPTGTRRTTRAGSTSATTGSPSNLPTTASGWTTSRSSPRPM